MCYDKKPTPARDPIKIAGDLVRRDDRLSKEAARCIRDLVEKLRKLTPDPKRRT